MDKVNAENTENTEMKAETYDEAALSEEEVSLLSQEEAIERLTAYRTMVGKGMQLSVSAATNGIKLVSSLRHRAIMSNPRATKAAKAKAAGKAPVVVFDADSF